MKVVFRTRHGKALLIKSRMADGSELPMGADVLDENNTVVGIAGQGANLPPHRTDKRPFVSSLG